MKTRRTIKAATISMMAILALVALLIGPTAVLAQTDMAKQGQSLSFTGNLDSIDGIVKFKSAARTFRPLSRVRPRKATPLPEPIIVTRTTSGTTSGGTTSGGTTSGGTTSGGTTTSSTNELSRARSILAGYIAKYPILSGATVTIGTTPGGYQAVAYYTVGRIVISSSHTSSLERIIGHEIWHIIDYRDNGQIDWGENVPPANYP